MKKKRLYCVLMVILFALSPLWGCVVEQKQMPPDDPVPPVETPTEEGFSVENRPYGTYFTVSVQSDLDSFPIEEVKVKLSARVWDGLFRHTYAADYLLKEKREFLLESVWTINDESEVKEVACYVADKAFFHNELQEMKRSAVLQYDESENPFALLAYGSSFCKRVTGSGFAPFSVEQEVTLPARLFTKEEGEIVFYLNPLAEEAAERDRAAVVSLAYEKRGETVLLTVPTHPTLPPTSQPEDEFQSMTQGTDTLQCACMVEKESYDLGEDVSVRIAFRGKEIPFLFEVEKKIGGMSQAYNVMRITDLAVWIADDQVFSEVQQAIADENVEGNHWLKQKIHVSKALFEQRVTDGKILVVSRPKMRDLTDRVLNDVTVLEWTIPSSFFSKESGAFNVAFSYIWDVNWLRQNGLDENEWRKASLLTSRNTILAYSKVDGKLYVNTRW